MVHNNTDRGVLFLNGGPDQLQTIVTSVCCDTTSGTSSRPAEPLMQGGLIPLSLLFAGGQNNRLHTVG